ncbi:6-bladed beta-propeller [Proteiniphilum sp.]|uniref:6-bladed beta-propeller n=1 Tax=Proteiniphilum sp. TaxID=1926877 RepID=UPI002B2033EC|nr:6-bladed beta-propeller [Proteiniphilum sp.]MEA4919053.1 6-bladed beta-propeller [Proteiniphilum sp.]
MIKKVIFPFLFCSLLIACNRSAALKEGAVAESGEIKVIKPASTENTIDISPYLDTIRYVKLELTDESMVGYIQKMMVFEERIYILDTHTSSLFVFDIDGNYLFKIFSVGEGPKEYMQVDLFDIDSKKRQIVLTDLMANRVLRYNLDGHFISRTKIPFWIDGIVPGHDGGYVMYTNYLNNKSTLKQEYNLLYLDSLMNITQSYFPYSSEQFIKLTSPQGSVFYPYNGDFYFFTGYGNTIHKVGKEELSLVYSFDFGDKVFDISRLTDEKSAKEYLKKKTFYSLYAIQETDEILSFSLSEPIDSPLPFLFHGYYSKKTNNLLYSLAFVLGKEGQGQFYTPSIAAYGSWLIAEIAVESLLSWKESTQNDRFENKFLEQRKQFTESLEIEDNPVLMFYRLKPF